MHIVQLHTSLPSFPKRGYSTKINVFFEVAEVDILFLPILIFSLLIWPFCTSCGCIQIGNYLKRVQDLIKCTLQHYQKCNLRILKCTSGRFNLEPSNMRRWISLNVWQIRKHLLLQHNFIEVDWGRKPLEHHLTMLILMHKLLFLLALTSPQPSHLLQ